jgi:hypothetical protein
MMSLTGMRWMAERPSATFLAWRTIEQLGQRYPGTIEHRWRDFRAFYRDMGERPPEADLHRLDANAPYSKANCEWRQRGHRVNGGLLLDVSIFMRKSGISATTLGRSALGDPRLVADLRNGRQLRTKTERRVRDWMRARVGQQPDALNLQEGE